MAFTLALDPTVKEGLRKMIRMGARNIHPDYMYIFNSITGMYDRVDDPCAWNGYTSSKVGVSLIRGRDGVWFLNGF